MKRWRAVVPVLWLAALWLAPLWLAMIGLFVPPASAQCAMCRNNAEAAARNGGNGGMNRRAVASLNAGIYMLLFPPVGVMSAILFVAFRRKP